VCGKALIDRLPMCMACWARIPQAAKKRLSTLWGSSAYDDELGRLIEASRGD
jgi:hypothetical protein